MRIPLVRIATFVVLVEAVYCSHGKEADSKLVTEWKKDPVCKAVYDAVLQGLYRDRVRDEIVTNIVGKQAPKNDRKTPRTTGNGLRTGGAQLATALGTQHSTGKPDTNPPP
ncbi:MAG: hypothetical protein CMJ70_15940 [Planctomycetaceae bacterium]|nr:hypothetical protein [Planctomycetaceae bacterium]